jgi:tetratricopeptide (TPR) repeat protein
MQAGIVAALLFERRKATTGSGPSRLAQAHSFIGLGKIYVGRAEETEAHIGEALRLSPRDSMAHIWMHFAGYAKNHLGVYERAVDWLRRAIEANRNYSLAFFQLAAAFAQLGRLDEARSAVGTGLDLDPAFSLSRARAGWTAMSDDPIYLTQLELNLASMRIAGVPGQ